MIDKIINDIESIIVNLFKKCFKGVLNITLDILKWALGKISKPLKGIIKKIKLPKINLKGFYNKYIISPINNGIKHKKLIKRMAFVLIIVLVLTGGLLYGPKVRNHFKSTNNVLSFVEYDTNKKMEVNEEKKEDNPQPVSQPVQVDNSYGWPVDCGYYISNYFSSWHNGIDLAGCPYGSNILATFRGEVVASSYTSTNGNYIVILDDNGIYQMYAHLSNRYVSFGQRVDKGTVIGTMGATGYATGVHLHYATWHGYPHYGGTPFNPYSLY